MRAGIVGNIGKRCPGLNGIKILSRDPRESIGKSVLLFPFFLCFFLVCILWLSKENEWKTENI